MIYYETEAILLTLKIRIARNTKSVIESFLHSVRIIKSSKYIVSKHIGTLDNIMLNGLVCS